MRSADSREAAFFSGINVKRYVFGTFVLSGILAAFGGLVRCPV